MSGAQQQRTHAGGIGSDVNRQASVMLPSPGPSTSLSTEDASYAAAQELASVMNAPGVSSSWLTAWPFAAAMEEAEARPPPLPPGTLPGVSLQDFSHYLRSVGDRLETFKRNQEASKQRMQQTLSPEELRASQGQGLVAAMRDVPAPFFQEAFDLDQRQLWEELVQMQSEEALQESLERLSGYLDIVETHLVREIAARTENFFDASGYIQDVRGSVARLYLQVSALRQQMYGLEQEAASAMQTSQQLQRQRANVVATLDILRAMDGVAQAQSALQGLLPCSGGVAVDYAGAIDVLEVLQGVLDDEALLALDCFKHLPEQIVETAQAVDDLMTSDFLERTRFTAQAAVVGCIRDRLRMQLAAQSASTPQRRHSSSLPPSRQLSVEESAELEALAAVRLTDMAAVEGVVGWLERMAGASELSMRDEEGGGEAMQEVLLPLVIGLQRMGRLPVTMHDLKGSSATRLNELVSQVIEGCLDVLDPEAAPGDSLHLLASHRSTSPSPDPPSAAQRLQRLPGQDFQWVLEAVVLSVRTYMDHCTAVGQAIQLILTAAKASTQQLAAAAQEMTECCHAVAEAAASRWSKLLGSMEGTGGSIRLADLQGVLELTDVLASLAEQHGVRGVMGLRRALQQLCKASLDGMHAKTLSKLTTLLEQEQWLAVEVPCQFQAIVEQLQELGAATAGSSGQIAAAAAAAAQCNGVGGSSNDNAANGSVHQGLQGSSSSSNAVAASSPADAAASEAGVPRKFTITPHEGPAPGGSSMQQQPGSCGDAAGGAATAATAASVLVVAGQGYHVVNTQLLLLSMLRDYLAFRDTVPAFSAEVAQRVLELLKVFNSRACQLVLGAGAMQVSGLKSITAKHLAISCQCLDAFIALHPALVALFMQGVTPPRLGMLTADFGRALQDYRIHHEEVCSKLVSIMRERLSLNIKQLPAQAAAWPAGSERPELPAPSAFATTSAKQLQILSGALTPLLLPAEVHSIFGRIGLMFSRTLAEAYELLEPHGAAWEQQLRADMQYMLNCLRNLPQDPAERDGNLKQLTLSFEHRFLRPAPAPAWLTPEPQRQPEHAIPTSDAAVAAMAAKGTAAAPLPPAMEQAVDSIQQEAQGALEASPPPLQPQQEGLILEQQGPQQEQQRPEEQQQREQQTEGRLSEELQGTPLLSQQQQPGQVKAVEGAQLR